MHSPVIFREYDIRGVYEKDFDLKFAYSLGRAFATYLNSSQPRVAVGFDARLSSPLIEESVVQGLLDSGVQVIRLGLVTSPMCYFSTFALPEVSGAIQITGSHNPPEYNGFKVSVGKSTIFGEEIQKLMTVVDSGKFRSGTGKAEELDIRPIYLKRYLEEFGQIGNAPKIVLDCGNGAAGCVVRDLFEQSGVKANILFEKPDGRFPNHHPDPTVEKNVRDLAESVRKEGAVAGIGFDGDADRIGVVDHNGKMIYGDELMVVFARSILSTRPGATIIGDVKCSDRMYADVEKHGGKPLMWKTGHSLIKEKIKSEKSPFGGEMSGHIFFADRNYGYDDAMYAGLRLVEILAKSGKTITQLLEGLPSAFSTPEIRIDTTEEKKLRAVDALRIFAKDRQLEIDETDGVRIKFEDGWSLTRASNTQPVLVLRFESHTELGLNRIEMMVRGAVEPILRN